MIVLYKEEDMGEYQYRSNEKYLLPTAVYHQCIWMIRDMERMEKRVSFLNDELLISNLNIRNGMSVSENLNILENRKKEIKITEDRLEGIYYALDLIPEEYINPLLDNIINHIKYNDYAHENTWKKWKQRLIYHIACNLKLY